MKELFPDENDQLLPDQLLNMHSHAFTLQYARAGKFFNLDWLPTPEEYLPKHLERIWPSFKK